MSELLELCGSENLSLNVLQETINLLRPHLSSQDPSCIHQACGNKKVTLKIFQLLYNTLPGALHSRDDEGQLPLHFLVVMKI